MALRSSRRPVRNFLCAVGMLGAGVAHAQETPDADTPQEPEAAMLQEVIVTARQRAEALEDVPAAITAFTLADIQASGIERPEHFIALTPGVSVVPPDVELSGMQVSMRGINSGWDMESSFAFVVDGVLLTNPGALNQEFSNITQIEVLKGPQGAVYGRNASGGAIIISTHKPTQEFEMHLDGGFGNNDLVKGSAFVSGGLSDTVAASIGAYYRDTEGFRRNSFTDRKDVDQFNEYGVQSRLIWKLGDSGTLDLRAKYSELEGGSLFYNATTQIPAFAQAFAVPEFWEDINDHDFRYINNVPGMSWQENVNLAAKADWEVGPGTLTAIASFNDQKGDILVDLTATSLGIYASEPNCAAGMAARLGDPLPPPFSYDTGILPPYSPTTCDGSGYEARRQKDYSAEIRLTSPGGERVEWIAGLYYADIERHWVVSSHADLNQGFLRAGYVPPSGPNPTELLFDDLFTIDAYAAFGQVTYDVTESLELAVSGRYDREERQVENAVPKELAPFLQPFYCAPNCYINPAYNVDPTLTSIPSREETYSHFQPKVSLNWDVNPQWTLYASYGIGFRSGGFNSQGSQATIAQVFPLYNAHLFNVRDEFDKEVSKAGELGFHASLLDRRLSLNGAVYQTNIDDSQFMGFYVGPFGVLRLVTNIDEVEIRGVELDFKARLGNYFSVFGGVGYIDSEIEKNTNRPITVGNRMPFAPEYTANLGGQVSVPLGQAGLRWTTRAEVNAVGETWFHEVQDEQVPSIFSLQLGFPVLTDFSRTARDPYELLSARTSIEAERWSVSLWGRNLGNKKYVSNAAASPDFGGAFVVRGPERSYGIDLTYSF